jgi:hypothetical protein
MNLIVQELRETLRQMAWSRVKGELASLLYTFNGEPEEFEKASTIIDKFVAEIENNSSWL